MDLSNLSSNWKRLQQTLASGADSERSKRPAKRKATVPPVSISHHLNGRSKRRKQNEKPKLPVSKKRRTFGHIASRAVARAPSSNKERKRQHNGRNNMGGVLSFPSTAAEAETTNGTSQPEGQELGERHVSTKPQEARTAGKYIAIDCEMVGTTSTTIYSVKSNNGNDFSILARVSVVSYAQETLYDTYVLPPAGVQITDFRTKYSGITPWHLNRDNETTRPRPFEQVQQEVADLLHGRILVGHAITNDLAVLGLSHPKRSIRDTSSYPKYRALAAATKRDGTPGKARKPALRMLASSVLGYDIQNDDARGHDSVEDARATMALYQREKKGFEDEAVKRFGRAALAASAAPRPVRSGGDEAAAEPTEGLPGSDAGSASDEVDEDEDEDDDDEAADEAEVEHAGELDTTGQSATPAKKGNKKKKKKKKGKYRR